MSNTMKDFAHKVNKALREGSKKAQANALRSAVAGMAAATHGRARLFVDRKREANRRACRGRIDCD